MSSSYLKKRYTSESTLLEALQVGKVDEIAIPAAY
jgi:hypothetical protein